MLGLMTALAVAVYLAPALLACLVIAREGTPARHFAILIPAAIAADLVLVLTLARFVRLDLAIVTARALELTTLALALRRARTSVARPRFLDRAATLAVASSALVGAGLSYLLSRPYTIWDRPWHELLVPSLRGQTLPFSNVYDPSGRLPYHLTGDVAAATLQALSLGHMHSSRALSIAHDVDFALAGVLLALLLIDRGVRRAGPAMLATLVVLTAGPATVLHSGPTVPPTGWSLFNFLTLSYRPHTCLALVLMLGLVATLLARLEDEKPSRWSLAPLFLLFAILGVTDEATTALLLAAVGVVWLGAPKVVHEHRRYGAVVLASMPAVVLASNALFAASLAPGAPKTPMWLIPFRVPIIGRTPASAALGSWPLLGDLLPTALFVAALAWLALSRSSEGRRATLPLALVMTTLTLGVALLTRLDVKHKPIESHRFITAALVLAPALFALALADARARVGSAALAFGPLALAASGAALGGLSTFEWVTAVAPTQCETHASYFSSGDLYAGDCSALVGPTLGARTTLTYIEPPMIYAYAGCVPSYVAAGPPDYWSIQVYGPVGGDDAIATLDSKMVKPDESVQAICMATPRGADHTCDYARANHLCEAIRGGLLRCALSPEARKGVLETIKAAREKKPK
jgi:hypothetical protein